MWHILCTLPAHHTLSQPPSFLLTCRACVTGDVDEALELVHRSDGIARAKEVAVVQAEKAMSAILTLHDSPAQNALVQLAHKIVNRNH